MSVLILFKRNTLTPIPLSNWNEAASINTGISFLFRKGKVRLKEATKEKTDALGCGSALDSALCGQQYKSPEIDKEKKSKFKTLNSYFEYSTRHSDRQKYVHTDI